MGTLLFVSITINVLSMIYCVYHKRVKSAQEKSITTQEQLYEQVDELQYSKEAAVAIKQNEAYGQISSQTTPNPPCTTGV